jgi:hypothetical protein
VRRGSTYAQRWIVHFADGGSAFAKAAGNDSTAQWLRQEHRLYSSMSADYLPRVLGWSDDGARPILLLEDLSGAVWPPPWPPGAIDAVLATLARVRQARPACRLAELARQREQLMSWRRVAEQPEGFLGLGLCSARWLERALPDLLSAEAAARLEGDDLLHCDLKSDNIALAGERVVLIDWNFACRGNGLFDVASWLPMLCDEGGPRPQALLPGQGALAALLCGYFALRAPRPPPQQVPRLRELQVRRLKHLLPWAAAELGLPLVTEAHC